MDAETQAAIGELNHRLDILANVEDIRGVPDFKKLVKDEVKASKALAKAEAKALETERKALQKERKALEKEKKGTLFNKNKTRLGGQESGGTIGARDSRGTLGAVVAFIGTVLCTAWQLWSVMYGDRNPFLASLSVLTIPSIYQLVKTMTGYDLKSNDVKHYAEVSKLKKESDAVALKAQARQNEIDKLKTILKLKNPDLNLDEFFAVSPVTGKSPFEQK